MSTITAEAITFDQAVTTGAEAVETARAIMHRAIVAPWPDDAESRKTIQDAIWPLADSLAIYEERRVGIIRPGEATSVLRAGPAALAEALGWIAEGVSRNAARVVRVMGEHCGSEAAAKVRGSKGEQS